MSATNLAEVRRQLIRLCGSKRTRTTEFSPEAPCDWRPHQVVVPGSGELFTDAGAWEFIVELLDAGHELEEVVLDKPPGRKGHVLLAPGARGQPDIYIKLQLGSGVVRGRSFHDSKYGPNARRGK